MSVPVAVTGATESLPPPQRSTSTLHDGSNPILVAPVFSAEESKETRPVHPEARTLFNTCGGKLGFIRYLPVFGPSIEAFGPKLVTALDCSEFLSKGVANYALQYSFFPMFTRRFGCSGMVYQRYQNVAMMGWSIKPLTALVSDSFALFGYTKRWYMVLSALVGAACCFGYGVLPGRESSAPIAAVLAFLAGYCMANLDILSEGFYSRLMRRRPLAGPALVSTVWWMINAGGIVSAFIEGPLSDKGKEALGAFVAGACILAASPFFVLNWYQEKPNREERLDDYHLLRRDRLAKAEEEDGDEHDVQQLLESGAARGEGAGTSFSVNDDTDVLSSAGDLVAARKNAALQQVTEDYASAVLAEMPSEDLDLVGFSNVLPDSFVPQQGDAVPTQHQQLHVNTADHSDVVLSPMSSAPTLTAAQRAAAKEEAALAAAMDIPRLCGGMIEVNKEVLVRNKRVTVYAVIMTIAVIALAIVTTLTSGYELLYCCVTVTVVLAGVSFWALPVVVAKAGLFSFLSTALYVQFPGALNSFYTSGPDCVPDGPDFSLFFYNSLTSVIGNLGGIAGVTAFTYIFTTKSYRITFMVTITAEVVASIFDLIMVNRWNVAIGIPDHAMYICGDAVVYQAAYMLAWMPMVVLLSQLCPRGSESMVYALLAAFSNLGTTMATEIGTLLMDLVWPVVTTVPCDFSNVKWLIIVGHLITPMLNVPLVFLLIPGARVCDELDDEGHVIGVKGETEKHHGRRPGGPGAPGNASTDRIEEEEDDDVLSHDPPRPADPVRELYNVPSLQFSPREGSNAATTTAPSAAALEDSVLTANLDKYCFEPEAPLAVETAVFEMPNSTTATTTIATTAVPVVTYEFTGSRGGEPRE